MNQNTMTLINPSATLKLVDGEQMVVAITTQTQGGITKELPTVYTLAQLQAQLTVVESITAQLNTAIALIFPVPVSPTQS